MKRTALTLLALCLAGMALPAAAQSDVGTADKATLDKVYPSKPGYSPYAGRNFPTLPLFGDTHLHTSFSFDAGAFGARLTPNDAYRFARGEQVTSNTGQPVKLSRPLDFLVVADHSDGMGFFPQLMGGDPDLLATPQGRKWYDEIRGGKGAEAAIDIITSFGKGQMPKGFPTPGTSAYRNAWQQTIKAAEDYNEPGRFTAFIGYEWTSNTGRQQPAPQCDLPRQRGAGQPGRTVHHTAAAGQRQPSRPVEVDGGTRAEDRQLRCSPSRTTATSATDGCFRQSRRFGKKLDREYAETRAKWERLYEVTQTKGTGEAHPFLSPNDEFANFELWDKGNLDGTVAKTKDMLEFEYARAALKNGLALEARLGVNPFKFGMIGSSDAHTGLAAMEEDNFFGKTAPQEPSPERMTKTFFDNPKTGVKVMDWEVGASGYAAVWATREHARGDLRRDEAPRDVCDHRAAHDRALLRRLGLRRRRTRTLGCPPRPATARACRWVAT